MEVNETDSLTSKDSFKKTTKCHIKTMGLSFTVTGSFALIVRNTVLDLNLIKLITFY